MSIQIQLPAHLRSLVSAYGMVEVEVDGTVTLRAALDALELQYPVLCGTIRDHVTHERRSLVRFFVCGEDWTHESPDAPLPERVSTGKEPLLIVGAIAGG